MTYFDRVKFSPSGTPGTGAITVGSAASGFQTPAGASVPDGNANPLVIVEGTAWEVCDSVYTVSGTSQSRGTLLASSTGSRVSFTSAAVVSYDVPARDLNLLGWQVLKQVNTEQTVVTGTTSKTTSYSYTLPAKTVAAGGRLRFTIHTRYVGTNGAKTFGVDVGGTTIWSLATASNILSSRMIFGLINRGATNSQILDNLLANNQTITGNAAADIVTYAIDFSSSQTITFTITLANGSDSGAFETILIEYNNDAP